jgi:hypothetical protein
MWEGLWRRALGLVETAAQPLIAQPSPKAAASLKERYQQIMGSGVAVPVAAAEALGVAVAIAAEAERHRELEKILGVPIDWDGEEVEGECEEIEAEEAEGEVEVQDEVLAQPVLLPAVVPVSAPLVLSRGAPFDMAIVFKEAMLPGGR